jgi:septal ring factor EnvC (AmiA/AmiB activator)
MPIDGRRMVPDDEAAGMRHRGGILLETAVAQTVSAPTAGAVAFAGAFRGFGLLLIIDRGDGYHTLLSGLSRLDVARGATVIAGQAVGAIGVGDGKARLYVELRHRGTPVDPAGWLASREDRVRG